MAKPNSKPSPEIKQVAFPVAPFISQEELVNVLRLRSNLRILEAELDTAQTDILRRLDLGARVERGPWTCASVNLSLTIWRDDTFCPGGPGCEA